MDARHSPSPAAASFPARVRARLGQFIRQRLFGSKVTRIACHRSLLEQLRLSSPAEARLFRGELVKDHKGRRDILRITIPCPEQSEVGLSQVKTFFLKRNWKPYRKDGLASLFRHGSVWSASRQEWENGQALAKAGVRTATAVAYGEDCGPFWEHFSYLLTEAAVGTQTVEHFLRQCGDRAERRRVFDALAREVRRMHDAGLATPDLFTRHVFVNLNVNPPQFCWIDMARLDQARSLPRRRRARDLAALNITAPLRFVSARERIRFLIQYAGEVDKNLACQIRRRMNHLLVRKKFRDFKAKASAA